MNNNNKELINDIQVLLNRYEDVPKTSINPALLEFMDRETLLNIISSLLKQQENTNASNLKWLEQFKKYDL